jgi:hypothetical protein
MILVSSAINLTLNTQLIKFVEKVAVTKGKITGNKRVYEIKIDTRRKYKK